MRQFQRGLGIVEISIASAVGVVLLGVVLAMHAREGRRHGIDDARLTLLQGVLNFEMELDKDLKRLALDPADSASEGHAASSSIVVRSTPEGFADLDIRTLRPAPHDADQFGTWAGTVHWSFDPTSRIVRRDGKAIPGLQALLIRFEVRTLPIAREPDSAFPGVNIQSTPVEVLRVECVACTAEGRDARGPLTSQRRLPFVFAVPLRQPAQRLRYEQWNSGMTDVLLAEDPS